MPPLDPQAIPQVFLQAVAAQKARDWVRAKALLIDILAVRPKLPEALFRLGQVELAMGQVDPGLRVLERAFLIRPGEPVLRKSLIAAWAQFPDTAPKSVKRLRKTVQAPVLASLLGGAADRLMKLGQPEQAEHVVAEALRLTPKSAPLLTLAGDVQGSLGNHPAALAHFEAASRANPQADFPHLRAAVSHEQLGQVDAALTALTQAIQLRPGNGEAWRLRAMLQKTKPNAPELAQLTDALDAPAQDPTDISARHFALAKMLQDVGRYDGVFDHLHTANKAVAKATPYDPKAWSAETTARRAAQDSAPDRVVEGAHPGEPIFVTGPPRSGTTLMEQILAAHPDAYSGGEAAIFSRLAENVLRAPDGSYRPVSTLSDAEIAGLGHAYMAEADKRSGGAPHFVDKSILTFEYLGLLHLALPQARVIATQRDFRDTGLSIYKNVFQPGTHLYAYDLRHIGDRLLQYEARIRGWAEVGVPFSICDYDALVADPETQARALVAAAGLIWDPACLSFYKTARSKTLSAAQVAQPIHAGSSGGWRRFQRALQPLIETLKHGGWHGTDRDQGKD